MSAGRAAAIRGAAADSDVVGLALVIAQGGRLGARRVAIRDDVDGWVDGAWRRDMLDVLFRVFEPPSDGGGLRAA